MKVCCIINDLSGGGAEKVLQLLSAFLIDQDHEVKVVTLQSGQDAYALHRRVERLTLSTGRFSKGIGKVAALPLQAHELSRVLEWWQPDVCVANMPRFNLALLMTRWFGYQGPILITEHAYTRDVYPSSSLRDRVMRGLIRRFYAKANGIVVVSRGVGEGLAHFGLAADKLQVLHNPVDVKAIQSRASEDASALPHSHLPTVINVGRHAEQKDHETLIRAFAVTQQRVPSRLVLLGQGPLRGELESLACDLGMAGSVVFAGWQANPFAWLAQANLFVLSSRYEGFGNVIVEAMACGLPVISTDCPSGPSEILRDGQDGILVPVGDVNALADAMTRVLLDDALRRKLSERSRKRAPDFDISVIGPQYEQLLISFARKVACVDNFSESFVP